jgi:hypothetical protein
MYTNTYVCIQLKAFVFKCLHLFPPLPLDHRISVHERLRACTIESTHNQTLTATLPCSPSLPGKRGQAGARAGLNSPGRDHTKPPHSTTRQPTRHIHPAYLVMLGKRSSCLTRGDAAHSTDREGSTTARHNRALMLPRPARASRKPSRDTQQSGSAAFSAGFSAQSRRKRGQAGARAGLAGTDPPPKSEGGHRQADRPVYIQEIAGAEQPLTLQRRQRSR